VDKSILACFLKKGYKGDQIQNKCLEIICGMHT
jgi:hypothetical protein